MKEKTKTQSKPQSNRKKGKRAAHYPAHYMAVILAMFILLEGFMLGVATPSSVTDSLQILDVSEGVEEVINDFVFAVEPMIDMVYSVNSFYQLAAAEMTAMLDLSDADLLVFPRGVVEFYDLASLEMMQLLDFSEDFKRIPQVAGISIFR